MVVMLCSIAWSRSVHAREYDLVDLYMITLDQSERIRISKEDVVFAEQGKNVARSALLPRLSAFGTYTRYSADKSVGFGSSNVLIQPEGAASWGVGVEQLFSLGGKEIIGYTISKNEIKKSNHDLEVEKENDLFMVASSFYEYLKAKKALEIALANRVRLERHRDDAALRLKVGEVTKTDLLRAEAELSGAQSDLVRAENVVKFDKVFLARVVGITGEFDVREPDPRQEPPEPSLPALMETAFRERSELKSSELRSRIAEDRTAMAKSSYWPTISVSGGYAGQTQNPSLPFAVNDSLWAGATLNLPIFEGGLRKAEVEQAETRSRQTRLLDDDLRKTIAVEVENAWLDYRTQRGVLQSLRDQLDFARDNFNSVSKQYTFGLASSIDVIDANTLLLTAERQLADADLNCRLSLVRIQRATGLLLRTVAAAISGKTASGRERSE
jgi:outer membrane protein